MSFVATSLFDQGRKVSTMYGGEKDSRSAWARSRSEGHPIRSSMSTSNGSPTCWGRRTEPKTPRSGDTTLPRSVVVEERSEEATRLPVAPGEHHVIFHHPAGDAPGYLELQAEQPPSGTVWELPLPEDGTIRDPDRTYRGHGFPSVEHLSELNATLRSNLPPRLEQVTLSHWMPGHAYVNAAVAIVGWAAEGTHPRFDRLRMQSTGFAQFFGTRPLRHITAPGLFESRQLDEVTVGFEELSDLGWTVDGVETSAQWGTSIGGVGDAFHFEINSSPWIEVSMAEPIIWDAWLRGWVRPVIDPVSLATGEAQHPTAVDVSRRVDVDDDDDIGRHRTARVFGSGVGQAPFTVRFAHHRPPLFALVQLPYSFNELVARWLDLRRRITGFVDAYLPIVRGAQKTVAADLLLLTTAAEAIHTARRGEGPTSPQEHAGHRKEVLGRLAAVGSNEDITFVKRHLNRRDRYSLEQRLMDLISDCPAELHDQFGLDGLALPRFRASE